MNWFTLRCFSTFVVGSLLIAVELNKSDPKAQMDETCHCPQAFLYCKGIYDQWNSVITTLPGLYIFSVGPIKILQMFLDIPCSVYILRMFNLIVNSLSFLIIHRIVLHYHSYLSEKKRMLVTWSLAIFPLNYFFTFLYYTDPLSTSFLLLMHLMWLQKSYNLSALAGFCAVLTRQTCIVWVFFQGAMTINEIYEGSIKSFFGKNNKISKQTPISKKKNSKVDNNNNISIQTPTSKKNSKFENNNNIIMQTHVVNKEELTSYEENKKLINYIRNSYIMFQDLIKESVAKTGGYILVGILFAIFVYVNNGIVVGDKESHTVNVNFPQILYFTLFTGIFTLPIFISQFSQTVSFALKHKLLMLSIFVTSALIVHFNTVAHHYNLEDSHHFTHHFLNVVYYHPVYALSFVPIYTICSLYIIQNLIRSYGKFLTAIFIFTLAMNLVPQLLLEFRYYVPGFLFFRMRLVSRKWKVLLYEFALYFLINLVTISLYIVRPALYIEDRNNHQIIMW